MKLKLMLSTVLIAGAMFAGVISAHAESSGSTAAMAPGTTSSGSVDAMTALFGDPVIAKGTGFQIKRSDLDQVVTGARANFATQGQQIPADFDAGVLNQLVTIQMMLQKATDADRAAGKLEADTQYTNLVARMGSTDAFERQLKIAGITADQLRSKAAQEATAKIALKRELNVTVTPEQIRECYTNHEANFEEPEKVHAEHILLMTIDPTTRTPLSTNTIAAKHKQAEDILKRVKAGEDFGALARQYSEDQSSKVNGGELPPFARGEMVPEFEAAAFSLAPGQVSDIVTSAFGFHIIKVLDKTPAKKYGLNDAIPEANHQTPAEICASSLESDKIKELAPAYIQKLRLDLNVQIVDPTLKEQSDELMQAATNAPVQPN